MAIGWPCRDRASRAASHPLPRIRRDATTTALKPPVRGRVGSVPGRL